MSADLVFVCGLILTIGICVAVVRHIQPPLLRLLVDLCGSEDRARFWVAFSNVVLLALPTIFSLRRYPDVGVPTRPVFEISDQLQSGLIGLVISVFALGIVLSHFILHARPHGE